MAGLPPKKANTNARICRTITDDVIGKPTRIAWLPALPRTRRKVVFSLPTPRAEKRAVGD